MVKGYRPPVSSQRKSRSTSRTSVPPTRPQLMGTERMVDDQRMFVNLDRTECHPKEKMEYKSHVCHSPRNVIKYNRYRRRLANEKFQKGLDHLGAWWHIGGIDADAGFGGDSESSSDTSTDGGNEFVVLDTEQTTDNAVSTGKDSYTAKANADGKADQPHRIKDRANKSTSSEDENAMDDGD